MVNVYCIQKDRSEETLGTIFLSFPMCGKAASIK